MAIQQLLSKRADASGLRQVLLRVVNHTEGYDFRVKTEARVSDIHFDTRKKEIKINRKARKGDVPPFGVAYHERQQELVTATVNRIAAVISRTPLAERTSRILSQAVDDELHGRAVSRSTLPQLIEAMIADKSPSKEEALSQSRCCSLRTLERALLRYQSYVRHTEKGCDGFALTLANTDADRLDGFADYLRNEAALYTEDKEKGGGVFSAVLQETLQQARYTINERSANSINLLLKDLKSLFNWLVRKGEIVSSPACDIDVPQRKYGTPVYITIEERDRIASAAMPTATLAMHRDIFIFQCHVGCRVSDLQRLTEKHITDGVLVYTPVKTKRETGAQAHVPLTRTALALIDKYRGLDARGRLFPCCKTEAYNDAIRRIFKAAGVTRTVEVRDKRTGEPTLRPISEIASSHMARRTFVGGLYSKVKDPAIICKMSGHTEGSAAFARYRRIDDNVLREAVSLIER